MSPSSLYKMANRACIKNIRSITDVGDAPYQLVRSFLLKLENPQQLRKIELASPQICGPDGEIWLEFIKRDVPGWDKKPYEPENPKKWYKAYKKLVTDSQKEVENDAAELKATLDRIKQDQAMRRLKEVELKGVKVPEGMKSKGPVISLATMPKMLDRGTMGPVPREMPREREWKEKDPNAEIPVRVKPNKSKLDRFRKEAKAMAHFQPARRPGIWTPTDMAEPTRGTIPFVPSMILEERRKAAVRTPIDPSVKPAPVFAPKRKRVEPIETPKSGVLTNEEREKRLKAFTNPSSANKSTPTQGLSTPPPSDPATSPRKANVPILRTPKLATSPIPKIQPSPSVSTGLKRASPAPGRPAIMKKAPVDVFMPAKRWKVS